MALKKPPKHLSFESIRKTHAPKSNFFDDEPDGTAEPTEDAEARASEVAQDAREPEVEERGDDVEPAPSPAHAASDPGSLPETGPAGEKEASVPDTAETDAGRPSVERPARPRCSSANSRTADNSTPATPASKGSVQDQPGKVTMRARVALPIEGVYPRYDQAKELYGEASALKLILDAALAEYETALATGTAPRKTSHYYASNKVTHRSRAFSLEAYDKARSMLDPMGLLSPNSFARLLMQNALVEYLTSR